MIATMSAPSNLEVTITHHLRDAKEVQEVYDLRLIAISFCRNWKSTSLADHKGSARKALNLFLSMQEHGAAVVAAYKAAKIPRSSRLIGWVEPGSKFVHLNGLLCLPLKNVKVISAAANFLGNLPPSRCTLQQCHDRSQGRLYALVHDKPVERSVWSLHHRDVEWLVTNFLIHTRRCVAVWGGGSAFEDIDHVGFSPNGREVLAQTTVSKSTKLVQEKAQRLSKLSEPGRDLLLFCPEAAREGRLKGIEYYAIEDVFAALDKTAEGRWLIDLMLLPRLQEPSHATEVA